MEFESLILDELKNDVKKSQNYFCFEILGSITVDQSPKNFLATSASFTNDGLRMGGFIKNGFCLDYLFS